MPNQESHNLERAVKEIAPDKAAQLAAKYRTVMESIDSGLIKTDKKVVDVSKDHLQKLANSVISTAFSEGSEKMSDKQFRVEALDSEITAIAKTLGISLEKNEASDINKSFAQLDAFFEALHINFPKDLYQSAYLNSLVFSRIDIKVLIKDLNDLKRFAGNSDHSKSFLYASQNKLMTAVGQFCNGKADDAFATIVAVKDEMGMLHDPETFKDKTGLKLSDDVIQTLMDGLMVNNKISNEETYRILAAIRKENPDTFANLHLSGGEMIEFLAEAILTFKSGKKGAKEFVARGLIVESAASTLEKKTSDQIDLYSAQLERASKGLQEYKKDHPNELKSATILSLERKIALLQSNIKLSRFNQFRVKVQRYLAMSYAENSVKKTEFAAVSKDIFGKNTVDGLRSVAEKYKLQLPPDFSQLEVMELDYQGAMVELGLKNELNSLTAENKDLYNQFYTDFSAGKLDTDAKKDLALHQIYEESQALAKLSDANEKVLDRDRVGVYALIEKYGSFSKVPENERETARTKVATYLTVLAQGQAIGGKLLGTYINVELLNPKEVIGQEKTPVAKEIADLREYLQEVAGSMEDMGKFLEVEDFKAPQEENVATSPLFMPILAREFRPFNEKCAVVSGKVVDAASRLGHDMADLQKFRTEPKYFEKQNIPQIRLMNSAVDSCDYLQTNMQGARNSMSATLGDLQAYKAKIAAGGVELVKKYPSLKDALLRSVDNAVAKVNFLLNDEKSPLSTQKINELRESRRKLVEARDSHLEAVFYSILAVTVITGVAVAGGILAAGLASADSSLFAVSFYGAVGGVAGSRVGMATTNALNWTKFSSEQMWSPENLTQDLLYSWGLSLLAIGAARGTITGLTRGAGAKNLFLQGSSKWALGKVGNLQEALSPASWVGMSEAQAAKTIAKKFGIKFAMEYGEEMGENVLQDVNPVLGFVASVINSAHGVHLELGKVGLDIKKTNVGIEGNDVVYKTGTAEEFVGQMETYFADRGATNFKTEIGSDGTVKMTVTDAGGRIAKLEVKPAKVGLDPNVEVKRTEGVKFDSTTNKYAITKASEALPAMTELTTNGFVLEKTDTGIKATKGDAVVEIEISPRVQAEIEQNLKTIAGEVEDFARAASEVEKHPTPSMIESLQLKFAVLAMSLLNTACSPQEVIHDVLNNGIEGILSAADGVVVMALILRVAMPKGFGAAWKVVSGMQISKLGDVFSLHALTGLLHVGDYLRQKRAPSNLGARMQTMADTYDNRSGPEAGDRAAQALGVKFQEALTKTDKKIHDELSLLEYTESFTGADRRALAATVRRMEILTSDVFEMLNGTVPWDNALFNSRMAEMNRIVDSLKNARGLNEPLKNAITTWKGVFKGYILYKILRLVLLNGKAISYILTGTSSSDDGGGGSGHVEIPSAPESVPTAPEIDNSAPTGGPAGSGSNGGNGLNGSNDTPVAPGGDENSSNGSTDVPVVPGGVPREKPRAPENGPNALMEATLTSMANKYGITTVKLFDNTSYDARDLNKNLGNVEAAFILLRNIGQTHPVMRYVLTVMPIYILPTSNWRSWHRGEGFNKDLEAAVIDSTEKPNDIVIDVRDAVNKFARAKAISKDIAIEALKNIDAKPVEEPAAPEKAPEEPPKPAEPGPEEKEEHTIDKNKQKKVQEKKAEAAPADDRVVPGLQEPDL